jgi:hypothetical protein
MPMLGNLGEPPISLTEVDRVIAIGSDGVMAAVAQARHGILAKRLKPEAPPRMRGRVGRGLRSK